LIRMMVVIGLKQFLKKQTDLATWYFDFCFAF
jgi:hypothetical protein